MRRRDLLVLLGVGSLAWPLFAQAPAQTLPVLGFLSSVAPGTSPLMGAFHQGLGETGFVEGRNVAIEYRWAEGRYDRLPSLAADLVRRRVAAIVATGGEMSARAARDETTTIPVLFLTGYDPVQLRTVAGVVRGGGNSTGISLYTTTLALKRLEFLRELMPAPARIATLVNPNSVTADIETKDLAAAAHEAGIELIVLTAGTESEFAEAFAAAARQRADALLISADAFFTNKRAQLVALAEQHAIRVAYPWREYVQSGGLMSYGPRLSDAYRDIGRYAGRVLKGATPADLPIQGPRKFELVINLKTAKALGLTLPPLLLARADEVIE
jgi:putative ABC transport system substrate-binding protein